MGFRVIQRKMYIENRRIIGVEYMERVQQGRRK